MIINFQTYKSSIQKRLDYLTRENEDDKKIDVFGNRELFKLLHKQNTSSVKSFNFLVSFRESKEELQEKLSRQNKTIDDLYAEIIELLTVGYSPEELNIFSVGHFDTDNYHFHITIDSQNQLTGTQLHFERSKRFVEYLQAVREYISLKYGLDFGEKRLRSTGKIGVEKIKQLLDARGTYREKTRDEVKEEITNILAIEIANGTINTRDELVNFLQSAGFQISRAGKDYITVKYGTEKIRLKGGIYSDAELGRIKTEIGRDEKTAGRDIQAELGRAYEKLISLQRGIVEKIESRFRTARERATKKLEENIFIDISNDDWSWNNDRNRSSTGKLLHNEREDIARTGKDVTTGRMDTRKQLFTPEEQKSLDIQREKAAMDRKTNSYMHSGIKQKLQEAIMDFENKRKEELQAIKELDPETVLNDLGISYIKRPSYYEAKAVWRGDRNPSLSIFRDGNIWKWKDHGTGEAGTWIDLVMKVRGYDYVEAVKYLRENFLYSSSQSRKPQQERPQEKEKQGTWILQDVRETELPREIKTFLYRTRGIKHFPSWLRSVEYELMNSQTGEILAFSGYGVKDVAGNYHIRQPRDKVKERVLRLNPTEGTTYSLIKRGSRKAVVVEGFIDGIHADKLLPDTDIVILNGVENWRKAINELKRYNEIFLALDNDEAGRTTEQEILKALEGKGIEIVRIEFRAKDLDEAVRKGKGVIYQPIRTQENENTQRFEI